MIIHYQYAKPSYLNSKYERVQNNIFDEDHVSEMLNII